MILIGKFGDRALQISFEGGFECVMPRRVVKIHESARPWAVRTTFEVDLLAKTITETRISPSGESELIPHNIPLTDPLQEQLRAFVRCIRDHREGTGEFGHLAVALADQAKQYGRP